MSNFSSSSNTSCENFNHQKASFTGVESSCGRGENRVCNPLSQLPTPGLQVDYAQDANWDTTAVVGFNGTTGAWGVTQRYVYSPYGSITVLNADWSAPPAGTQPVVNNLYQGMTLDVVTGLYDERFRNYSPTLGTWISQDPLQYINGADTYQFVMGNPVGMVDPRGLFGVGAIGTGGATAGVVAGGGATAAGGAGVFIGHNGISGGGFLSGGAAFGTPGHTVGFPSNTGQTDFFGGRYAGVGGGIFMTNAGRVSALNGPFKQWNLDTPFGSVSFAISHGIWICSLTAGRGAGAAVSGFPTTTVSAGTRPINIFANPPGYVTDVNGNLQVVPP